MAAADNTPIEKEKRSRAKRRFFIGLLDMSWRLALAFLLPVFLGLWLDGKSGDSWFAIAGLVIGVIGSVFVIKNMVKRYSAEVELDD